MCQCKDYYFTEQTQSYKLKDITTPIKVAIVAQFVLFGDGHLIFELKGRGVGAWILYVVEICFLYWCW